VIVLNDRFIEHAKGYHSSWPDFNLENQATR
jgi:hypothetical protein